MRLELIGILPVDKPAGLTSFGVVAKARGMARTKKVGHAGTLDPAATGVLPLFLGSATRFIDLLPEHGKRYTATFVLGITTDTQDVTGTVLRVRPVAVGGDAVAAALPRFTGTQRQLPPMYSAVRKDGKRLYELARQGLEVERELRTVEISRIDLLWSDEDAGRYQIDVVCSKGTYIRTLCHDLGELLGCGAALESLRRTAACGFTLDDCRTLTELQDLADGGGFFSALLPVESAFTALPRLELDRRQADSFCGGVRLDAVALPPISAGDGEHIAVFDPQGVFLGLAALDDGRLRHVRVLARNSC